MKTSTIRSMIGLVLVLGMLFFGAPLAAHAATLAAPGDIGCQPGNVFSTATGDVCTNATYLNLISYNAPTPTILASSTDGGCYRGYIFSIATGHICTNATYYFGPIFY